jgi:hypothetical protein
LTKGKKGKNWANLLGGAKKGHNLKVTRGKSWENWFEEETEKVCRPKKEQKINLVE